MMNIKIFVPLRKGHYSDYFNLFVMKHLLCDTVTVDQFQSPNSGKIDTFLEQKFDFNRVTINFENMYAQGKCDRKIYVGCGPMNLSPRYILIHL